MNAKKFRKNAAQRSVQRRRVRRPASNRRGLAELEFVMMLPLNVLLLFIVFYIGRGAVDQLNLANATRLQAWSQRGETDVETICPASSSSKNEAESAQLQGQIDADGEKLVRSSLVFDKWWKHQAASDCRLYAGSWEFRSLEALENPGSGGSNNQTLMEDEQFKHNFTTTRNLADGKIARNEVFKTTSESDKR